METWQKQWSHQQRKMLESVKRINRKKERHKSEAWKVLTESQHKKVITSEVLKIESPKIESFIIEDMPFKLFYY